MKKTLYVWFLYAITPGVVVAWMLFILPFLILDSFMEWYPIFKSDMEDYLIGIKHKKDIKNGDN